MAEHSSIEWTDATWNPITGCSVVSPGCTNCYAMRLAGTRLQHHPSRAGLTRDSRAGPVWTGEVRLNKQWLDQPLRWSRPRMIFVCAHSDLFHEAMPDEWIAKVFAVMTLAPQHTFQILTKRAKRMQKWFTRRDLPDQLGNAVLAAGYKGPLELLRWPLRNVWLGVSAEDQQRADERIPHLLATPAAVRWVSAEPLLGPLDLTNMPDPAASNTPYNALSAQLGSTLNGTRLDWIVAGGESGPGARPIHPEWARSLRDQCKAAGVPFHFKQWGEWAPICAMSEEQIDSCYQTAPPRDPEARRRLKVEQTVLHRTGVRFEDPAASGAYQQGTGAMMMMAIGKASAGRLLDGVEHNGMPGHG